MPKFSGLSPVGYAPIWTSQTYQPNKSYIGLEQESREDISKELHSNRPLPTEFAIEQYDSWLKLIDEYQTWKIMEEKKPQKVDFTRWFISIFLISTLAAIGLWISKE